MNFHNLFISKISVLIILALSIDTGIFLRVQNVALLENQYLIGSDSYRHFRHIRQIVENGSLPKIDTMRNAPFGRDNTVLPTFFAKMFARIFKIIQRVFPDLTLRNAAIFYSVLTSGLIFLVFFLFVRRLFNTTVALFSVISLSTIPAFLNRTIAGFVDQDSATMLFCLIAFYFFIRRWAYRKKLYQILFMLLSGIAMGILSLVWPGTVVFVLIVMFFHLIRLWRNEFEFREIYLFLIWFAPILFASILFTGFYRANLTAPYTVLLFGAPIVLILLAVISASLPKENRIVWYVTLKGKIPLSLSISFLSFFLLFIFYNIYFGLNWTSKISSLLSRFSPFGKSTLIETIGELYLPYSVDWWHRYGLFFFLAVAGVILLSYQIGWNNSKSRFISSLSFFILIAGTVLSRFKNNSILDGNSTLSKLLLGSSVALFLLGWLVILYLESVHHFSNKSCSEEKTNKTYLLILLWFSLGLLLTRLSGQRFNLVLAPAVVIAGSFLLSKIYKLLLPSEAKLQYFLLFLTILAWQLLIFQSDILTIILKGISLSHFSVSFPPRIQLVITLFITALFLGPSIQFYLSHRKNNLWVIRSWGGLIVLIFLTLTPFVGLYGSGTIQKSYVISHIRKPHPDLQQRKAIEWIRKNTPSDSVVVAWWDLGSAINELGRRSTIIDEQQILPRISDMARHVICGTEREALEFLKSHSATYLLLDKEILYNIKAISKIATEQNKDKIPSPIEIDLEADLPNQLIFKINDRIPINNKLTIDNIDYPSGTFTFDKVIIPIEWRNGQPFITNPPQAKLIYKQMKKTVLIKEIVIGEKIWYFPQGDLNGCVWIDGFNENNSQKFVVNWAAYLPETIRNFLIVKLFREENSRHFETVYDSRAKQFGDIDVKIWRINYPNDIKINPGCF